MQEYRAYLAHERRLAASSIERYLGPARLFVSERERRDGLDLEHLTASDVTAFVVSQCRTRRRGSAKVLVTALRSLLRFLFLQGYTTCPLAQAVPTATGWADQSLPRALGADAVTALLNSCDRHTVAGMRDFAILTLLARLGLRAGEVAALTLEDIDWHHGEMVVRGKGGRRERKKIILIVVALTVKWLPAVQAQTYSLPDYWGPVALGDQWLYAGTDWDGQPAKMIVRIDDADFPLTCLTGRNPVSTYIRNVVRKYCAYVHRDTLVPYDTWYEYWAQNGWVGYGYDDNTGEYRVDPGDTPAPSLVSIGQTISSTNDFYTNGVFCGQGVVAIEILEHTNVIVPAGTYPDCLLLRWTLGGVYEAQIYETWMARSVGVVKKLGISGGGAAQQWDLIGVTFFNSTSPSCSGDDFNDNVKDPARWGPDIEANSHTNAATVGVETNGRLEFTGPYPGGWPWICSYGSYTQDWEVLADVGVGETTLTQSDSYVGLVLGVVNPQATVMSPDADNIPGDGFVISLRVQSPTLEPVFASSFMANGVPIAGANAPTTVRQASLRVSFTATNKTLSAWYDPDGNANGYNWTLLQSVRIDTPGSSWNMTNNSLFAVLLGWSRNHDSDVVGTGFYADNFIVSGAFVPAPPAQLSIKWANGQPVLTAAGGFSSRYALEYTPSLAASNSWQSLTSFYFTNSPQTWIDTTSTNSPQRFYRAVQSP